MARLSMQISAALGGKPKFDDFIRYHDAPDADREVDSAEAFAALFKAKKKDE